MKQRVRYSGVSSIMAGCFDCWGSDAHWFTRNAMGLAAQHHDRTGHITWCEQVVNVTYGGRTSDYTNRKKD